MIEINDYATQRLVAWIRSHGGVEDCRVIGDRIRVAGSAVSGEGHQFTEIEFVRTTKQARELLGY